MFAAAHDEQATGPRCEQNVPRVHERIERQNADESVRLKRRIHTKGAGMSKPHGPAADPDVDIMESMSLHRPTRVITGTDDAPFHAQGH